MNMEYFSEAHFRAITNRMSLYEQRTYSDNYQGLPMNEQFDIFLSYNISDSDVVKGIFYALSNMGFKVYLDCIVDANMKRNVQLPDAVATTTGMVFELPMSDDRRSSNTS